MKQSTYQSHNQGKGCFEPCKARAVWLIHRLLWLQSRASSQIIHEFLEPAWFETAVVLSNYLRKWFPLQNSMQHPNEWFYRIELYRKSKVLSRKVFQERTIQKGFWIFRNLTELLKLLKKSNFFLGKSLASCWIDWRRFPWRVPMGVSKIKTMKTELLSTASTARFCASSHCLSLTVTHDCIFSSWNCRCRILDDTS